MTLLAPRVTRRRLLAGASAGLLGVAAARHWGRADDGDALRLLCWEGYENPGANKAFSDARGLAVQADYLGANDEIFTFLRAGGLGQYDLVTPSNGLIAPLVANGLIQPIDLARLKNTAGLFPAFAQPDWTVVDGKVYAVPYTWRTGPLVYDAKKLSEPPAKWTDLITIPYKAKVVMPDDVVSHFLTWNRALGVADPARVTTFELNQTVSLLVRIKRDQTVAFVGGPHDVAHELATGRSAVSTMGWESVPSLADAKGADLRLAHPEPGDFSICDSLCIPVDAPHLDAAYAFIDAMLTPEAQAKLAAALFRGSVTSAAVPLIPEGPRGLFGYDDLDKVFTISPLAGFPPLSAEEAPGFATYVDWVVAWDRIRFTAQLALATPTKTPTPKPTKTPSPTPSGSPRAATSVTTRVLPLVTKTPT